MKKNLILSLCVLFIIFAIIISPSTYIQVALKSVEIWAKVLLPALFPFFVFTKLLTSFGYVKKVSNVFSKINYKLYKTPPISAYVFFMSILTGYPVGSKLVCDLYLSGEMSKDDAKKCITYTSNSGPMFIIGSVGIGMLLSRSAGYIILVSHIIGALLNGLLYKNIKTTKKNEIKKYKNNTINDTSLSQVVLDSIFSILLVGGIIVIAFICIAIIENLGLLNPIVFLLEKLSIPSEISLSILSGFFEITKGCLCASSIVASLEIKTIICCFIISFGGISTILQAMAFLKEITSYKFFFLQKITHAIFSTIVCVILCLIFL